MFAPFPFASNVASIFVHLTEIAIASPMLTTERKNESLSRLTHAGLSDALKTNIKSSYRRLRKVHLERIRAKAKAI